MKKLIFILVFFLLLLLGLPFPSFAEGEGNMDGGGGNLGSGTGDSFWYSGDDGVRVTVVRASDNSPYKTPVDYSNITPNPNVHFGKKSKLTYKTGTSLTPQMTAAGSAYVRKRPDVPLPQVVSSGGGTNIEAKQIVTMIPQGSYWLTQTLISVTSCYQVKRRSRTKFN